MTSRTDRTVRVIWRTLTRTARYLVTLLRDALAHVWRIATDTADGAQYLWWRWQAQRQPATASRFETWRGALHERRAARWARWGALTTRRRMELRAASVALLLLAFVVARSFVERPPQAASDASSTEMTSTTLSSPETAPPVAVDLSGAVNRMRSEMSRARSGQALFLADGPVLAPASSERWNGFRIAAPAVLLDDSTFRLWYRGCRLHGVQHDCAIGHATSTDGLKWTATGEAVLVPSDAADEFDLGWIAVVRAKGMYFMWYSVAPDEFTARPTSTLHLATSADGLRWQEHGRVLATGERTVPVQPSVVHDGTQFHLWFADSRREIDNGYEMREGAPFLRHFTSQDGRSWREAAEFPMAALDLGRVRVSVARESAGSYRAFYFSRVERTNGEISSSVGWLVSADGNDWRMANRTPVVATSLGVDVEQLTDATGLQVGDGVLAWFVTQRSDDRLDVRAAFYKE